MAYWKPTQDGFGRFFFNTDIESGRVAAQQSEADYLALLRDQAANNPTLEGEMKAKGYMNADGSLNPSILMDHAYLNSVNNRINESNSQGKAALTKAVANNAARRGGVFSTENFGKNLLDMQHQGNQQYADVAKAESGNAINREMQLGSAALSDSLRKNQLLASAQQSEAQLNAQNAAAQTGGMLQDPARIAALAVGVAGTIGAFFTAGATAPIAAGAFTQAFTGSQAAGNAVSSLTGMGIDAYKAAQINTPKPAVQDPNVDYTLSNLKMDPAGAIDDSTANMLLNDPQYASKMGYILINASDPKKRAILFDGKQIWPNVAPASWEIR